MSSVKSTTGHASAKYSINYPAKHQWSQAGVKQPASSALITSRGLVFIEGPVSPEKLHEYRLDEGLKKFRTAEQQKLAMEGIAALPESYVYIARQKKTVIGYVMFLPPDEYLCWGNDQIPGLLELGAIEVTPAWRRKGIGSALLREAFKGNTLEDYLIISMEFSWHWDLENSKLTLWEYRQMLIDQLGHFSFELWSTNDLDVLSHPANTFMVRVGRYVPEERVDRLKRLCVSRKQ